VICSGGEVKTAPHYLGDGGTQVRLHAFDEGVDAHAGIRAYARGG
jgi:hypothetical protein